MSKVLIFGMSPLPTEDENRINAHGIRTWQFAQPLLKDGHKICLICLRTPGAYEGERSSQIKKVINKNIVTYFLPYDKFNDLNFIQRIHNSFKPNCIVSASAALSSYVAAQLYTKVPLWVDRFGDPISEFQSKAHTTDNDDQIYDYWKIEDLVLEKGDIFSTVSDRQKYALIGQLGAKGRLNKETIGYDFVYSIPIGIADFPFRIQKGKKLIRGRKVKKDAFVILWSGGYNTWTNVDTLFYALEMVMKKNKKIIFVSTGGSINTHDEITYPRFLNKIARSAFKDRFVMLGWIKSSELRTLYSECNLAINIDKKCYEGELGSRNRILDWAKSGLPVLTTNVCELSDILCRNNICFEYPLNDKKALAKIFLQLSADKKLLAQYAERAKKFTRDNFSFEKTTESLRKWVKRPIFSPDKANIANHSVAMGSNSYIRNIESGYIDGLRAKVASLENESRGYGEKDKIINNLNIQLTNLDKEIRLRDNKLNEYGLKLADLTHERNNLSSHANNLEKARNSSASHIDKLTKGLKAANLALAKQGKEIQLRDNRIVALTLESADLKHVQQNLNQHARNLEQNCENYNAHIAKLAKGHKSAEINLKRQAEELQLAYVNLNKQGQEIVVRDNKIHALNLSTTNLIHERDDLKTHADNLTKEVGKLNLNLKKQTEELQAVYVNLNKQGQEIVVRDNKIHALNLSTTNLIHERDNLKTHAKNLEEQLKGYKGHIDNLSKELEGVKGYIDTLNSALSRQGEEIKVRENKILALEMQLVDLNNHVSNLNTHANNLESERNGYREHAENLNKELGKLNEILQKQNEAIKDREIKLQSLTVMREELQEKYLIVQSTLKTLEQEAGRLNSYADNVSKQSAQKDSIIMSLSSEKNVLLNQLNDINKARLDLEAKLESAKKQNYGLEERIRILNSQFNSLTDKLERIESTFAFKSQRLIKRFIPLSKN